MFQDHYLMFGKRLSAMPSAASNEREYDLCNLHCELHRSCPIALEYLY